MRHYLLKFNILLLLISISSAVIYCYQYVTERDDIYEVNNNIALEETNKAATKIEEQIRYLIQTGQQLKLELTGQVFNGSNTDKTIKLKLEKLLAQNNKRSEGKIFAVGVALNQGVFAAAVNDLAQANKYNLKSWYAYQKNGQVKIKAKDYDYTLAGKKRTAWYTKAVEQRQPVWQEPKFSSTSGAYIIGYSIPFYRSDNQNDIAGVITLNYSITELKLIMRARNFWKTGYGFIVSEQGHLIYHPNERLAKQQVITSQISATHYNVRKDDLLRCFLAGGLCLNNNNSISSGGKAFTSKNLDALVFSRKIKHTNWRLHVVFIKNEQGFNSIKLHSLYVRLVVSLTSALASLVIFMTYWQLRSASVTPQPSLQAIWFMAFAISCIFICGLALIAREANINLLDNNSESILLTDYNDIQQQQKNYLSYSRQIKQKEAEFVKTGLHIQSLDYQSTSNLVLTGFIWQKYKMADTPHFSNQQKGVVFANAVNSQVFYRYADHHYIDQSNGIETIGWYFKVQLAQSIDHSTYPFDSGLISLTLQHLDFANNVVLVPDIDAYPLIYRTARPGLQSNLSLSGWDIVSTYFSLHKSDYSTNMGINDYIERYNLAELNFNISIQRVFINPLITHITPMAMVFIILFLLMLLSTNNVNRAAKFGFNPMTVIAGSTALLFSTMLWHSSLREELATAGISYYECYYFLAYLMIALVAINSVILAGAINIQTFDFKDNFIPKVLYWPLLTGVLFFITLIKLG